MKLIICFCVESLGWSVSLKQTGWQVTIDSIMEMWRKKERKEE